MKRTVSRFLPIAVLLGIVLLASLLIRSNSQGRKVLPDRRGADSALLVALAAATGSPLSKLSTSAQFLEWARSAGIELRYDPPMLLPAPCLGLEGDALVILHPIAGCRKYLGPWEWGSVAVWLQDIVNWITQADDVIQKINSLRPSALREYFGVSWRDHDRLLELFRGIVGNNEARKSVNARRLLVAIDSMHGSRGMELLMDIASGAHWVRPYGALIRLKHHSIWNPEVLQPHEGRLEDILIDATASNHRATREFAAEFLEECFRDDRR